MKVKLLHENAILPKYQTVGSAGFDLSTIGEVTIHPYETKLIKTGLSFEIPEGYEMQIRPRSGVTLKTKLRVATGTIDSDYRGEVGIIVDNLEDNYYTIKKGERIAQAIISPVKQFAFEEVDELSETERGIGGFGSTGTK